MGKFNAGGFKPLMDLSSRYLDLKTISEKVHRGGERHTDKILVVSLETVPSLGGLGEFSVSAQSAGGGRSEEVGEGVLKLPFSLRNAGENQSLKRWGRVIGQTNLENAEYG